MEYLFLPGFYCNFRSSTFRTVDVFYISLSVGLKRVLFLRLYSGFSEMSNRNQNKKQPRRKPRRARVNRNIDLHAVPPIPRNLRVNSPFPESRVVKLTSTQNFILSGAALFAVKDFSLNSLWTFQSTANNEFSGASQLAAIYDSYHVQSVQVSFQLAANEPSIPVYFGLTFKDDQPSTSVTSYLHAVNALEVSPTTGPVVVGETTGMSIYRSRKYTISCATIVGNAVSYAGDQAYTASFGSNPNQIVWMGAIAYSGTGSANITIGIIVGMTVVSTVRVYSIKTILE